MKGVKAAGTAKSSEVGGRVCDPALLPRWGGERLAPGLSQPWGNAAKTEARGCPDGDVLNSGKEESVHSVPGILVGTLAESPRGRPPFPRAAGVRLSAQDFPFWHLTAAFSLLFQPSDTPSSQSPPNRPGARSEMEEKVV